MDRVALARFGIHPREIYDYACFCFVQRETRAAGELHPSGFKSHTPPHEPLCPMCFISSTMKYLFEAGKLAHSRAIVAITAENCGNHSILNGILPRWLRGSVFHAPSLQTGLLDGWWHSCGRSNCNGHLSELIM